MASNLPCMTPEPACAMPPTIWNAPLTMAPTMRSCAALRISWAAPFRASTCASISLWRTSRAEVRMVCAICWNNAMKA
ncbi:hypothetical protein D3C72_1886040 [compost metagenome]